MGVGAAARSADTSLYVVIRCFGGDAINGGSQIALLSATSVCVMLSIGIYRCKWSVLEDAIIDNIRASASAIIILLLIGAIAGSWMVSGVVPTMIYYGLKILHPSFFSSPRASSAPACR